MELVKGYNLFLQLTVSEGLHMTTSTVHSFPSLYLTLVALLTTLRATRPRNSSSIPGMDKRFFSFQKRSDQAWGPPSRVQSGHCVQLTTHLRPVSKLTISAAILPFTHTPSRHDA